MTRKSLVTLVLILASVLLAVALFVAGAIWRGRVTYSGGAKAMSTLPASLLPGVALPLQLRSNAKGAKNPMDV